MRWHAISGQGNCWLLCDELIKFNPPFVQGAISGNHNSLLNKVTATTHLKISVKDSNSYHVTHYYCCLLLRWKHLREQQEPETLYLLCMYFKFCIILNVKFVRAMSSSMTCLFYIEKWLCSRDDLFFQFIVLTHKLLWNSSVFAHCLTPWRVFQEVIRLIWYLINFCDSIWNNFNSFL